MAGELDEGFEKAAEGRDDDAQRHPGGCHAAGVEIRTGQKLDNGSVQQEHA